VKSGNLKKTERSWIVISFAFEYLPKPDFVLLEYSKIEPQNPNIEDEKGDSSPGWKVPRKSRRVIDG
jgi:hypothetical protein